MTLQALVFALLYDLGLLLLERSPSLIHNPWFKKMMAHCRPDWALWKTKNALKKVDGQAQKIVGQWAEDQRNAEANKLAKKAKQLFPEAKITTVPDAAVPSVMIEEDNGDTPLGGPMRITWRLDDH